MGMGTRLSGKYISVNGYKKGYVNNLDEALSQLEKELQQLREDIAEAILLESKPEAVSTYGMSYEESAELPYRARL